MMSDTAALHSKFTVYIARYARYVERGLSGRRCLSCIILLASCITALLAFRILVFPF